jgi:hypothetical protein
MRKLALLLSISVLASGCEIYFGDDDDECASGGTVRVPAPDTGLRNPETGVCEYYGGNPDPCYAQPQAFDAPGALPNWGACVSECTGLDQDSCERADGCRVIYADECAGTPEPCIGVHYFGCWATAQPPVRGGACVGLDPYTCALHDDCSAVHEASHCKTGADCPEIGGFISCQSEVDATADCSALGESACIERADCAPLYEGSDCSCDASGCHCNQETFLSCHERGTGGSACGPYLCSADEYCEHGVGGAPPGVNTYACKPLPSSCAAGPTCTCVANEPCGFDCQQDPGSGALTVTCNYP